jgi:enediyne biosynthesis protein E8
MEPFSAALGAVQAMTLEAFADTILPGEKRFPDDHAVAGVSAGGGSVAYGVLEVLSGPEGGLAPTLDDLAEMLNEHAEAYARRQGLSLRADLPAFPALGYDDRVALVRELVGREHQEREAWIGLAMFSTIAFDAAAHLHTADAIRSGHPGLAILGYSGPDGDGLWRFPSFSYGRALARPHPDTTPSGSPA